MQRSLSDWNLLWSEPPLEASAATNPGARMLLRAASKYTSCEVGRNLNFLAVE